MSQSFDSSTAPAPPAETRGYRWSPLQWLVVVFAGAILVALLLPAIQTPIITTRRSECRHRLRTIGLALKHYHEAYGCLPPAYLADSDGKPMHSWRVLLLPFIDQLALYREYRFDEPWNGPHNSQLADRIGSIYCCPSNSHDEESNNASYLAVIGRETAWPGTACVRFDDIADGTQNTLLVVEVADSGIHWMEPRDLQFSEMTMQVNPATGTGISSRHFDDSPTKPTGAQGLFADGSVRFFGNELTSKVLRALLTRSGSDAAAKF